MNNAIRINRAKAIEAVAGFSPNETREQCVDRRVRVATAALQWIAPGTLRRNAAKAMAAQIEAGHEPNSRAALPASCRSED